MYVYVGQDWRYRPGVTAQRQAEIEAARAANGGVDLLTGEGRVAGGGNPPPGLVARLIGIDPDNPEGPGIVFWVWETREQAEAQIARMARPEVREAIAQWMDFSDQHSKVYEVAYFGHQVLAPATSNDTTRQHLRYEQGILPAARNNWYR